MLAAGLISAAVGGKEVVTGEARLKVSRREK